MDLHHFVGARFSKHVNISELQNSKIHDKHFVNMFVAFLVFLGVLVSPLVLGLGDGFKNPEMIEMRSFGFCHKQIEILLYRIEAE